MLSDALSFASVSFPASANARVAAEGFRLSTIELGIAPRTLFEAWSLRVSRRSVRSLANRNKLSFRVPDPETSILFQRSGTALELKPDRGHRTFLAKLGLVKACHAC